MLTTRPYQECFPVPPHVVVVVVVVVVLLQMKHEHWEANHIHAMY